MPPDCCAAPGGPAGHAIEPPDWPPGCPPPAGQHQQWFLFDKPNRKSSWFETVGHCVDGSVVALFPTGLPLALAGQLGRR